MQFNTIGFIIFFSLCLFLYYQVTPRANKWFLLGFSLFFYSCFSCYALIVLVLIAIISWLGELTIRKVRKKSLLFLFLILTLLPLILLKYIRAVPGLVLPIGISFFTLQALSGMIDSYKQKNVSSNFGEHLLYLSFFPTVVSGPIIRKQDFLAEINKQRIFSYEEIRKGFYRIAAGYIEKFFLADQIGKQVNYVYNHFSEITGIQIVITTFLYSLQLYLDFAGYSHIAIGFAKCFGITLMENFERPFFSSSIKEFWRRWHISLSSWLRDYVYIPLGGSKKGDFIKYQNLIITFLISGIWHGVGFNFLFWGFLHGIYQVIEDILTRKIPFLKSDKNQVISIKDHPKAKAKFLPVFGQFLRTTIVFLLVSFAFLFFRAPNMTTAVQMLDIIITNFQVSSIFSNWWFYGLCKLEYLLWIAVFFVIFILDISEEKKNSLFFILERKSLLVRWIVYACAVFIILIAFIMTIGTNSNTFLYQNF